MPRVVVEAPPPDAKAILVDSVWLLPDRARALGTNDAVASAWFGTLAARNVSGVYLQVDESNDRAVLQGLAASAHAANVRVVAAVPLFLGEPIDGAAPARLGGLPPAADALPLRSPVSAEARLDALRRIRAAATLDVDALCFTHAGFGSADVDFSDDARFAFESILGNPVADWPGDVATRGADGVIAHGPLWGRWSVWRAGIVHDFLATARAEADKARADAGLPRVPVALMARGYYPIHAAEAVNWAERGKVAGEAWTSAPRGYERTAVGDRYDALVLEAFAPYASPSQARDAGLEWWASAEGALAVARKVADRPIVLAVSSAAWSGDDGTLSQEEDARWKQGLAQMRGLGVPLLVVE